MQCSKRLTYSVKRWSSLRAAQSCLISLRGIPSILWRSSSVKLQLETMLVLNNWNNPSTYTWCRRIASMIKMARSSQNPRVTCWMSCFTTSICLQHLFVVRRGLPLAVSLGFSALPTSMISKPHIVASCMHYKGCQPIFVPYERQHALWKCLII
jgi:hypothetical protein